MANSDGRKFFFDRTGTCSISSTDSRGSTAYAACNDLVLADVYGRVLVVLNSGPKDGATVPPGVNDFSGTRTTRPEMRRHSLELLGDNKYLVGFNLAWTLTALRLALFASRVIDIGTKVHYQKLCVAMASRMPCLNLLIMEQLINSFDCRTHPLVFR